MALTHLPPCAAMLLCCLLLVLVRPTDQVQDPGKRAWGLLLLLSTVYATCPCGQRLPYACLWTWTSVHRLEGHFPDETFSCHLPLTCTVSPMRDHVSYSILVAPSCLLSCCTFRALSSAIRCATRTSQSRRASLRPSPVPGRACWCPKREHRPCAGLL